MSAIPPHSDEPVRPADRLRKLAPWLSIAIFVAAIGILTHALRGMKLRDVVVGFQSIPTPRILASLGLGALSYLLMSCYELAALRYLGNALPARRVLPAAFCGPPGRNDARKASERVD
jgi:uncharacterized membrane protein YbhN (UPF0104 family)